LCDQLIKLENNMKNSKSKRIAIAGLMVASLLGAGSASAVYIEAVPAAAVVGVGGTVQVDIYIGDLTDFTAPSLGAYDLNVLFDTALLHYTGVSWGNQLDQSQSGSLALADSGAAASGLLNFFEVSYDDIATLNAQQSGGFTLFSVFFTALAVGESEVNIDVLSLGDAEGNALTADQVSGASVTAVPIPAALPLLMSGLLLLAGRIRKSIRSFA